MARHFHYKFKVFLKEMILDGPFGKTKYYAIFIEFQESGNPHVYSFVWIFNVLCIEQEAAYIEFIEKTISGQLPHHFTDPKLFKLVTTYQGHALSRTYWKDNTNDCFFSYDWYFTEKTVIAKPLDLKISCDEKKVILTCRNTRQVKNSSDNNLNCTKVNVIDPPKHSFSQLLDIKEILDELEICKDDN